MKQGRRGKTKHFYITIESCLIFTPTDMHMRQNNQQNYWPEIRQRGTLFSVTQLELVTVSKAGASSIGWTENNNRLMSRLLSFHQWWLTAHLRWVVTATCTKCDPTTAGPRTAAVWTPGSPVAILSQHIWGQLCADPFITVLQMTES